MVDGRSARSDTDLTGHSTGNAVVNFPAADGVVPGAVVAVRITSVKAHSLYGEFVKLLSSPVVNS